MTKHYWLATAALWMTAGSALAADTYAPWLTQIGLSGANASAANWGKYRLLGVVDTGIRPDVFSFAPGQVSVARSACGAVTFSCGNNGLADEYGHGTAVAAIAAGSGRYPYAVPWGAYPVAPHSIISVAPYANILSQKVFAAGAQSQFADVANGISRAADAGASVINVSISYWNGPEVVSAINYAASKGSFIVWAGGNDGTVLLGGAATTGLSAAAIRQLIFAGSVNAQNAKSYFSNTPGAAALFNTNGGSTALSARWLVAPGESILAPNVASGPGDWTLWSGTSMAAPIVSGSLILLESAWPILKTRRTAATLLLATTADLGDRGADSVFGTGLVDLARAFQPYGPLTVTKANGQTIAVSSLTGSMITGGALGSFWSVKSKLASYTALDGYARNYTVNLSGLIQTQPTPATLNPLPSYAPSGPAAMGFGFNPDTAVDRRIGYASHTDAAGTAIAFGYGVPVQLSYAKALYGNEDLARLSGGLNVSGLAALAQGGAMAAYGMQLNDATRIAFSWSATPSVLNGTPASLNAPWTNPEASAIALGLTHRFSETFVAGVTIGSLHESHGLLGSTYDAASPLSLGDVNKSRSYGFSAGFHLDRNNSLMFETGFADTAAASANGLFVGTTALRSRSHGVTFMSRSVLKDQDRFTFSVKQPLRVVSGEAGVVVPSIDAEGIAHYHTVWTSLAPNGRELHYGVSYDRPLARSQSLGLQAGYRKDALNVQGSTDVSIGAAWTLKF